MRKFFSGVVMGIIIVSIGFAADIAITKTTSPIIVNGEQIEFDAYNIDGYNYFRIKDLGKVLNFSVLWDGLEQKVLIDTSKPYEEQDSQEKQMNVENEELSQIVKIPQSDESFCPPVGSVVEAEKFTDGKFTGEKTAFTITKAKPEEPELPQPTCDWTKFPKIELTKAVVKDFGNGRISVLNLHETRRMQYTLYNLFSTSEYTWENGTLAKYKSGKYKASVAFELEGPDDQIQVMWPWRESELQKVFYGCPMGVWKVIAYDEYVNGKYTHTAYYLQN